MAKPIVVSFSGGVQFPPKLGTPMLKQTSSGKLAYGQNTNSLNDEYGAGAITPGPLLTSVANNARLTGVPFIGAYYRSVTGNSYLYYAQGVTGIAALNRVTGLNSGETPNIDTSIAANFAPGHSGHANQEWTDMVFRASAADAPAIYIAGRDDTDNFVSKLFPESFSVGAIAAHTDFAGTNTPQFLVLGADNTIYWIGRRRVSSINTSDVYTKDALANGLPLGTYATAGVNWNTRLAVAYSNDAYGEFGRRFSAGSSGVILWDYSDANFERDVPAPCRYISATVVDPSGNLFVFGGVDEGKSSLYLFTGYGFDLLYTYIGDMPRSRHSIEFDGQGRIIWITADGQICRYDRAAKIFDQLGYIPTSSHAGGFLYRGIGYPTGNEFIAASGNGNSYTMKLLNFDNFTGDATGTGPSVPMVVSGQELVPFKSTIDAITFNLSRPLNTGEAVDVVVYVNGDLTPVPYMTLDYSVDGAISFKREAVTIPDVNNFSLGVVWKTADGSATAPAVLPAYVEIT